MSLETYAQSSELYLARGSDVNPLRPLFTGDIFADAAIPGVQDSGMAVVVAHPCSMRGSQASLRPRVLVAAVHERAAVAAEMWTRGHFDETPIPELILGSYHVGRLDELGKALTADLDSGARLACMSAYGINLLQQRLVWHLTRFEVPTRSFQEAFDHTLHEVDLLEEWNDELCPAGLGEPEAAVRFEEFIRREQASGRTLQKDLREPQRRSTVRVACRTEAARLAGEIRAGG